MKARRRVLFLGYRRPANRGTGTRNFLVILGTSSRTAAFARQLAARLHPLARVHPSLDGVVAIAHTEGGAPTDDNNSLEVLRALAGFIVHPNVGAVLAVDYGVEPLNNARLRAFMREHGYPLDAVPHKFLTLDRGIAAGLATGESLCRAWITALAAEVRTPAPLSGLRIALQCGGSDAFSGVSGNPLAGAMVHEAIRHGATGVLTETDESMGAEHYLLARVRDLAVARAFLGKLAGFREKLAWHGLTPESNPSAGNRFRGLYNIALKSLGAVHKKDPRTRLDTVIDYAQPLRDLADPGFTFMNGPGNDLEGIAGQVGAGCNLILFVTGNGSITNFPFVPTLKITTTSRRHQLLQHEMDINAGRYLDGEAMESVCADAFETLVATASGTRTKGERAGHSQVSVWRNWRQTDTSQLAALKARTAPDGHPLPIAPPPTPPGPNFESQISSLPTAPAATFAPSHLSTFAPPPLPTVLLHPAPSDLQRSTFNSQLGAAPPRATERIGLILPTSLCSTQIARLAAERLNARGLAAAHGLSRFVGFTHTEGCGFGGETMYHLLHRTYRGYLTHPNIAAALLLEHGCEKVPNDVMRHHLAAAGVDPARFGWASVQLDGGIEKALGKIEAWFTEKLAALPPSAPTPASLGTLALALLSAAPPSAASAATFAALARAFLSAGGSVLLAESDPLLADAGFRATLLGSAVPHATLAYGEPLREPGLHIVATESDHWVENVTGLAACGAHLGLGLVHGHTQPGHPLLPMLHFAEPDAVGRLPADDIDGFLRGDPAADFATLTTALAATVARPLSPAAHAAGLIDFQLTRGLLGLTT